MRRLRPCRRSTRQTPFPLITMPPQRAWPRLAAARRGQLARLVGHAGWPPLAWSEHLQATAQDGGAPAVVGRGVDAEGAARGAHVAELCGEAEQPQPEAK